MNDAERFLQRWHAGHAGASQRVFGHGALADGRSSYAHLAQLAGDTPVRVLDLACGDGPLVELLVAAGHTVTGLDLSEQELAAARQRVPTGATLVQGRAQELPFEEGCFDLVLSHMALMLMSDIDQVIAESRRVLGPHGRLGFVVGGSTDPPDERRAAYRAWRKLRETHGLSAPPALGDPAWRSVDGVRGLLEGWEIERLEETELHIEADWSAAAAFFELAYYGNPAIAAEAPEAWQDWLEAQRPPDGRLRWGFSILLGLARVR